jgi:hypothetical protein
MTDPAVVAHRWHKSDCVFFVLTSAITRDHFDAVITALSQATRAKVGREESDRHWAALQERLAGLSWDRVAPVTGPEDGPQGSSETFERTHSLKNLLRLRPYIPFTLGGRRLTLDVFNPGNELALNYPDAGEPVLALLMGYASRDPRERPPPLATVSEFYAMLLSCAERLGAKEICGTHSLVSVGSALHDGRLWRQRSPWSPLHPLSVVDHPGAEAEAKLREFCAVVDPWPRERLLIQVMEDLDAGLWKQYADAAHLVGREPWTLYVEGGDSTVP